MRLHGLQRTELNDAVGKVIGPPAANGRVPVLLNAPHNKTDLIEPENLEKVLGAQPAATSSCTKRARAPVLGRAAARREAVPAVHAVRRLQVRRVLLYCGMTARTHSAHTRSACPCSRRGRARRPQSDVLWTVHADASRSCGSPSCESNVVKQREVLAAKTARNPCSRNYVDEAADEARVASSRGRGANWRRVSLSASGGDTEGEGLMAEVTLAAAQYRARQHDCVRTAYACNGCVGSE